MDLNGMVDALAKQAEAIRERGLELEKQNAELKKLLARRAEPEELVERGVIKTER